MKRILLFALTCASLLGAAITFTNLSPDTDDSDLVRENKKLASINANTVAIMAVAGVATTGTGSPNGVQTKDPGEAYFDITLGSEKIWMKGTGAGNTNWILIWSK